MLFMRRQGALAQLRFDLAGWKTQPRHQRDTSPVSGQLLSLLGALFIQPVFVAALLPARRQLHADSPLTLVSMEEWFLLLPRLEIKPEIKAL